MFDKPIDVVKTYKAKTFTRPKTEKYFEPTITKIAVRDVPKGYKKPRVPYINSTETFNKYQELRKTKEFKVWWWEQHGRQDGYCYYCDTDLTLDNVIINVEHVLPMSSGGTNNYSNMVLACQECNKKKGSRVLSKKELKQLRKNQAYRVKRRDKKLEMLPYLRVTDLEPELNIQKRLREAGQPRVVPISFL